jgi:hypothetical protein
MKINIPYIIGFICLVGEFVLIFKNLFYVLLLYGLVLVCIYFGAKEARETQ